MNSTLQGNYEMGEYSTVSNCRLSHDVTGEEVSTADQPLPQVLHYAQVDKKCKKKDVSEDPPCESGDVYSVVNKPNAPEIPQKSQFLLEELTNTNIAYQ